MRYTEIDSIKGLAIIGIIITHLRFTSRFDNSTLEIICKLQDLFGWCVLAFFFCSGFLAKPITSKKEIAYFFKKKILRLIVPCLVFSISYKLILSLISLTRMFSWNFPFPTELSDIARFLFEPVGPQFYFLYYLFFISVGVAIIGCLVSIPFLFFIAAVLFPVAYTFIDTPPLVHGSNFSIAPIYIFSYVAGHALSIMYNKKSNFIVFCCVLFISVMVTTIMTRNFVSGYIFVPVLLWLFFRQFHIISKLIDMTHLGKNSSAIYVWHAPIILPFISIVFVKIFGGQYFVILPIVISVIIICCIMQDITVRYHVLKIFRF